jgi:hypothetical protein
LSALTGFAEMFEGAEVKSLRFAEHYARVAEERGCAFLDTGQVIVSSDAFVLQVLLTALFCLYDLSTYKQAPFFNAGHSYLHKPEL